MTLLQIKNLSHYFGGLLAVDNFNLDLEEGELVGLIGPNGAGKTTVFNLVTGAYHASEGSIHVPGQRTGRQAAAHDQRPGDQPHVSDDPAVEHDDGVG